MIIVQNINLWYAQCEFGKLTWPPSVKIRVAMKIWIALPLKYFNQRVVCLTWVLHLLKSDYNFEFPNCPLNLYYHDIYLLFKVKFKIFESLASLALLHYWLHKFHKDRSIAGTSRCSYQPSTAVKTTILIVVKDGLHKCCNEVYIINKWHQ